MAKVLVWNKCSQLKSFPTLFSIFLFSNWTHSEFFVVGGRTFFSSEIEKKFRILNSHGFSDAELEDKKVLLFRFFWTTRAENLGSRFTSFSSLTKVVTLGQCEFLIRAQSRWFSETHSYPFNSTAQFSKENACEVVKGRNNLIHRIFISLSLTVSIFR